MSLVTIKVLRPFFEGGVTGKAIKKGEVKTYEEGLAADLINGGKAERYEKPSTSPANETTKPETAPVEKKVRK